MANKNFVVHNGLTVGLLTIDAATGDISTPGNVNISGNIGVSSINKNDSSIAINDSGSSSTITITVDGTVEHTVDADGVNLASGDRYAIGGNSVLNATTLGSSVVNSSLTSVGANLTVGSGSAQAIVKSNSTQNLKLTTNDGSSSNPAITLVQSDDGNIELDPSGTGVVKSLNDLFVGSGSAEANIASLGSYNLRLSTNRNLGEATILLNSGSNGNIEFGINGTGTVKIPEVTFGDNTTQTSAALPASLAASMADATALAIALG